MRTIRESGVGSSEVVLVKCKYRSRSVKTNKQTKNNHEYRFLYVCIDIINHNDEHMNVYSFSV